MTYKENRWQLIPTTDEYYDYAHIDYEQLQQEVAEGKALIVDQLFDEKEFPNNPYPGGDQPVDASSPSMKAAGDIVQAPAERKKAQESATREGGLREPNDQSKRKGGGGFSWLMIGSFLGFLCLCLLLVYLMRRKKARKGSHDYH